MIKVPSDYAQFIDQIENDPFDIFFASEDIVEFLKEHLDLDLSGLEVKEALLDYMPKVIEVREALVSLLTKD